MENACCQYTICISTHSKLPAAPTFTRASCMPLDLAGTLEPTIIYTLSKKEADEIGASLEVHMGPVLRWQMSMEESITAVLARTECKSHDVLSALQREGFRVGVYHAGLSDTKRADVHMQFLHDKLDVVRYCSTHKPSPVPVAETACWSA